MSVSNQSTEDNNQGNNNNQDADHRGSNLETTIIKEVSAKISVASESQLSATVAPINSGYDQSISKSISEDEPSIASARSALENLETLDSKAIRNGQTGTNCQGMTIGVYELLEQIGEGGMGAVYLAKQSEPVKRTVALKLIRTGMKSESILFRFQAERQALALMDHPQIAKVLDAGTSEQGEPYFVMELIPECKPLTEYADQQKLRIQERLELFISVCQGVQHAHQKGIIHRDLKPSNILVGEYDGQAIPKIIDFGVAKATQEKLLSEETMLTHQGGLIGTLEYMSPEQASQGTLDIDTRSDVYSLGVILCELLTGTTPCRTKLKGLDLLGRLQVILSTETNSLVSLIPEDRFGAIGEMRQLGATQLRGYLSRELNWIVLRALAKDREKRYSSAAELAADLQRYLNGEVVLAHPPSKLYQFSKMVKRYRWPFGLAVTVMVLLLSSTILVIVQQQKTLEQKAIAESQKEIAETQRHKAERQQEIAEEHRVLAEAQRLKAERQQAIAEEQRVLVETQRLKACWTP